MVHVEVGAVDAGCMDGSPGLIPYISCAQYVLDAGTSVGFAQPIPFQDPVNSVASQNVVRQEDVICVATAIGGGCGPGSVCVPREPQPWSTCVFQQRGDQDAGANTSTCPTEWVNTIAAEGGVPVAQAVATEWDDSHACTECACQADPEAGCIDTNLVLYSDSECKTPAATVAPDTCTNLTVNTLSAQYTAKAVHQGCSVVQPVRPTGIESPGPDAGYVVCYAH